MGNSDHFVVTVSIDFPSISKVDASFHLTAFYYSRTHWNVICEDIFCVKISLNRVLLILQGATNRVHNVQIYPKKLLCSHISKGRTRFCMPKKIYFTPTLLSSLVENYLFFVCCSSEPFDLNV